MTEDQLKAAASLKRALIKVRDADLKLRVYDSAILLFPTDFDPQDENAGDWEDHGLNINVPGLDTDGGAGI